VTFGALAAALSGHDARVLTVAGSAVETLVPSPAQFDLVRHRSTGDVTTTFANRGTDRDRVQRVDAVADVVEVDALAGGGHVSGAGSIVGADADAVHPGPSGVVHLGPVARELGAGWVEAAPAGATVVLTPQGLIRDWPEGGGVVRHQLVDPAWVAAVGARPVVVVLGASELVWVRGLGEAAIAAGGALVVTDGHRPATVRWPGGEAEIAPTPVDLADDTGAGDVFATVVGLEMAEGASPPEAVTRAHAAVGVLLPRIHAALPVAR
jgi:hypothetical protein